MQVDAIEVAPTLPLPLKGGGNFMRWHYSAPSPLEGEGRGGGVFPR